MKSASMKRSLKINNDVELRAKYTPELIGMSDVEAMAYSPQEIEAWRNVCSIDELNEFRGTLTAVQQQWRDAGLSLPYWGNLWVLRVKQKAFGYVVPDVSVSSLNELLT